MHLLLALALAAWATQVEATQVPCPLGGAPVQVFRLVSTNGLGGWDSDGASYSLQGQFRNFEVSTCPNHALSLYGRDMELGLSASDSAKIAPIVAELERDYPEPSSLEAWDRHAMAARTYAALGRGDWFVANAWLKASWTLRDAAVGELRGLSGPLLTRRLLLAGADEIHKELSESQKKAVLFNMAKAAHRGGYGAERDALLTQLSQSGGLDKAEQDALDKLRAAARLERPLQDQAMRHLTEVVRSDGAHAPQARFLLADLLRRTGRIDLALPALEAASRDRDAPDSTRALASYLAAELRGELPWEKIEGNPLLAP